MCNFSFRRAAWAGAGGILFCLMTTAGQSATPKTGNYTISALGLAPITVNSETDYQIDTVGLHNLAADTTCFSANVNLPDGATVTRVTVWYKSKPATLKPAALILRTQLSNGAIAYVALKDLPGTDGKRSSVNLLLDPLAEKAAAAATVTIIDNAQFSYGFAVCLNGKEKDTFSAARITFKPAE